MTEADAKAAGYKGAKRDGEKQKPPTRVKNE